MLFSVSIYGIKLNIINGSWQLTIVTTELFYSLTV